MQVRFKQSNRVPCSVRGVPRRVPNARKIGSGFNACGPALPRQRKIGSRRAKRKRLRWPVFLFLLALVVPWLIYVGPLRMSLYRIVLLLMILPCLAMWMTGKAGRIRTADIALLLFSFWCTLSFIVINGMAFSVQTIGINFIETLGPYLLARCYIRDADDFHNVFQLLFMIVVLLLPFAFFEFVSGQNISRELFAAIFPTFSYPPEPPRLGFTRVQSVFDHPILFGTCTGGIFALVHLVLGYQKSFFHRTLKTGIVGATSILSLSAGPLIMIVVQGLLLSWNWLLRAVKVRWKILIGLLVVIILLIEVVANRSIPATVSRYLAFDQESYWFRMVIWQYGSASALNHPLFGVGLNEWERPEWMPASIDNFYLFLAVRNGLPAPFLMLVAFFSIFLAVSFRKRFDDRLIAYRTGFLISMTAFFLVAWTVAFWDAAYVLLLFLLGSGVWMMDVETKERAALGPKGIRGEP
jgi:O-antigen ligase